MSLPGSWVERLFGRLNVRYGVAFWRQYEGMQDTAVKADWALALCDFQRHPQALEWALKNLPDTPPNASQFLRLCKQSPGDERQQIKALQAPKADPRRMREMCKQLAAKFADKRPSAAETADKLREMQARGVVLTLAQRAQLRACELDPPIEQQTMPHNPIPRENWPWIIRGENS